MCGCFFIGHRKQMKSWAQSYMNYTELSIAKGWMNTDQQVIYAMVNDQTFHRDAYIQVYGPGENWEDGKWDKWFHLGYLCRTFSDWNISLELPSRNSRHITCETQAKGKQAEQEMILSSPTISIDSVAFAKEGDKRFGSVRLSTCQSMLSRLNSITSLRWLIVCVSVISWCMLIIARRCSLLAFN